MIKYTDYKQEMKVAVDTVCIASVEGKQFILLIKRQYEPFKDKWALPGGFLHNDEEMYEGAIRELKEETNINTEIKDIEEIGVFGKVGRDPRRRIISVAYLIKLNFLPEVSKANEALEVKWRQLEYLDLNELAFDHKNIVEQAVSMLD